MPNDQLRGIDARLIGSRVVKALVPHRMCTPPEHRATRDNFVNTATQCQSCHLPFCSLLSRVQVQLILGYGEQGLSALLTEGLLEPPSCDDGLLWRRAVILRFIFRRAYDPAFAEAVHEVVGDPPETSNGI